MSKISALEIKLFEFILSLELSISLKKRKSSITSLVESDDLTSKLIE